MSTDRDIDQDTDERRPRHWLALVAICCVVAAGAAVALFAVLSLSDPVPVDPGGPDARFFELAGLPTTQQQPVLAAARTWCADVATDHDLAGHDRDFDGLGLTSDSLRAVESSAIIVLCPELRR